MIKITKKYVGTADRLYLSDSYVSNGHWLFSRDQLDPRQNSAGALGTICQTVSDRMTDADMLRAAAPAVDTARAWTVTSWLYETGKREGLLRIAVASDGTRMALSDTYCQLFGLSVGQTIYAKDADSVAQVLRTEDNGSGFVMPCRSNAIAELPSLSTSNDVAA